jgi:solute carrier family 25 carnitine/acylcarnitine transporter 20/29
MRQFGLDEDDSMNHNLMEGMSVMFAGGMAGIIGWVVTYPADVVKTRMQSVEHEMKPK